VNKIFRHARQSLNLLFSRSILDNNVLSLYVAVIAQTLSESRQ